MRWKLIQKDNSSQQELENVSISINIIKTFLELANQFDYLSFWIEHNVNPET